MVSRGRLTSGTPCPPRSRSAGGGPTVPATDPSGGGEREDPRAAAGQGAAHPVTVHGRQVTVEHDYVVGRLRDGLERRRAVIDGIDGHTGLTQPLSDPPGQ